MAIFKGPCVKGTWPAWLVSADAKKKTYEYDESQAIDICVIKTPGSDLFDSSEAKGKMGGQFSLSSIKWNSERRSTNITSASYTFPAAAATETKKTKSPDADSDSDSDSEEIVQEAIHTLTTIKQEKKRSRADDTPAPPVKKFKTVEAHRAAQAFADTDEDECCR